MRRYIKVLLGSALLSFFSQVSFAQPSWTIDPFGSEKKPKEYEEKKLPSEKTGEKKFTRARRFLQNTTTRYNYYFNANNKLNLVLERAKAANVDDYSEMISYYPYTLQTTAAQASELDSVIIKATNGILLHDLRTDWVDDMYFLIGKSYLFKNQLDSAKLTFQFINYNLFPREKGEDYNRVVGSVRESKELGNLSISNKEKRNIFQKALTLAPIRNESLLWLSRTFIEQGKSGEAAGILNILLKDPNFPARLLPELHAVNGYRFFTDNVYDSAAFYLAKGLDAATTAQDRGRWEYLLGQLYEQNGNFDLASKYFGEAAKHTVDPVLEIFANLQDAKMLRNKGDDAELANVIAKLEKMAKREKYDGYEDIIYYSLGQLALQRPDTLRSLAFYKNTVQNLNDKRPAFRNKSFYQMANISFANGHYADALNYYDSLDLADPKLLKDSATIADRMEILSRLVPYIQNVEREDSLQRIAAMPETERNAFIRNLIRQNRKQQGLKDTFDFAGNTLVTFDKKNEPLDMFPGSSKGDWYFYNKNMKSSGYNEFVRVWGKRQNVDNWRTVSGAAAITKMDAMGDPDISPIDSKNNIDKGKTAMQQLDKEVFNYEAMVTNLPMTQALLDSSNAVVATNLLLQAGIFKDELKDYPKAIEVYEDYLRRFGSNDNINLGEAYFGLYHAHSKLGNVAKADYYKNLVTTKYASSKFATIINNPGSLETGAKNPQATALYQSIYDKFLAGDYANAIADKKKADSVYANNYWTPQLLYIESMYYVKQKDDSVAIATLTNLKTQFPQHELANKATTLIDVLGRRNQIEGYLDSLDVKRKEDEALPEIMSAGTKQSEAIVGSTPKTGPVPGKMIVTKQPALAPKPVANDKFRLGDFVLEPDQPHLVVMVFGNIDAVYLREARNGMLQFANANYSNPSITISQDKLDNASPMLVFSQFDDIVAANSFVENAKRGAAARLSWLQGNKYSFYVISQKNLDLLKTNKNLQQYRELLNKNFDNKY